MLEKKTLKAERSGEMEALGGVCRGVMDEVKGADRTPRLY